MRERNVDVATRDGKVDTFITHPDGAGPYPGVIIYMDAPGIREELYDIARRVGTVGYYVMLPDLYYRHGRKRYEPGDTDQARLAERASVRPDNGQVVSDTEGLLKFMDDDSAARPGAVGAIGYCMSGAFVFCAAATYPERFRATAAMYGTRIVTENEDSPHLLAAKLQGELYCGFAENDVHVPQSEVEALRETLRDCPVTSHIEVHPGTEHAFQFPLRPAYHKEAAERGWERIFAMFQRQLKPGG